MKAKEQAVRDAADALQSAIAEARASGLTVAWPSRADDLSAIAISETGKASVTVQLNPSGSVSPEVAAKAGVAAQKAVDKVIENAKT